MVNRDDRHWLRQFAPALAAGAAGVLVSVAAWYLMAAAEDRTFEAEFAGRASNVSIVLQKGIDDYWDRLQAVRALIDSSDQPITRRQFEDFGNSVLAGYPAIMNIAWIPRIRREERATHEAAAARDGLTNYRIQAFTPENKLAPSPERDEYYPKYYSTEPRTSPAYGLDLKDGGVRERTLARIRDGDVLSISPPLTLQIGSGDRRGFWAGLPVYAHGLPHETEEERRRNIIGIVQGVFQIHVMMDGILGHLKTPVQLYLFAPETAADAPPIYFRSRLGPEPIAAKSQRELGADLQRSFAVEFGDIRWTLIVTPDVGRSLIQGHERSLIVLAFGLIMSGVLALFIAVIRRNAHKLGVANRRFEEQNLRFDAALNNMAQGLLMYDRDGRLTVSNRRFAAIFDLPWGSWMDAAPGTSLRQSLQLMQELSQVAITNEAQLLADVERGMRSGGGLERLAFERSNGRTYESSIAPTADGGFVATFSDITEQRAIGEKISHLAHYDALTDLPNRVLFYQRMGEAIARAPRDRSIAVFSFDLDRFKAVNDTLGHPIGDKLLQAVADRLRSCLRDGDVVARLGGDEFAIVQVSVEQPADVTALATRVIDTVSAAYLIDGHQVVVGTSLGIALAPADSTDPEQLVKDADLALYRCKEEGGNTYRFFEAQMDARMQERRVMELDLRKALVNGEFALTYQPIVSLKTGRVTACEAILFWEHPVRGAVPVETFGPIAEDTGVIVQIGEWALNRACAEARDWPDGVVLAVNVSPVQFKARNFVRMVTSALQRSQLPADRLELAVTESMLFAESDAALTTLNDLRKIGVKIAIDNFGTGYSSLGYLRSFPFDRVKIDRSFIRDLPKNKDSLAIVRAVVGLGASLNIATTAEGVSTGSQIDILRSEGCEEVQGRFFSAPKPAAELRDLLAALNEPTKAIA